MIEYRRMEEVDTKTVQNLMEQYSLQFPRFIIDYYPQRWSKYLREENDSEYWVATIDDEVVGHAGYLYNVELESYEIVGVVVSSQHQRKGIGKYLLHILCERVRGRGMNKVALYTLGHPGNEDTIRFYRSIGYTEIKYEKDFFIPGYSRVAFMKEPL